MQDFWWRWGRWGSTRRGGDLDGSYVVADWGVIGGATPASSCDQYSRNPMGRYMKESGDLEPCENVDPGNICHRVVRG
jgi:hypothetical protein